MPRRSRPGWRDEAAAALVVRHRSTLPLQPPVLVAKDPRGEVEEEVRRTGREVGVWHRRALEGRPASPWPPPGPWGSALLRLPRTRGELEMDLHAAASVLAPGGALILYGAKDEGIGSSLRRMEGLFRDVDTVATGGRCRLVMGIRKEDLPELEGSHEAWRETVDLDHPDLPGPWVSYPGVFAHGRLDPATRLLLDTLPSIPEGSRVLDYGSGSGPLAGGVRSRTPGVELHLLDVDALALEAARENVPGATLHLRDGLPASDDGNRFDWIVTNPPFHRGKAEEPGMILELIRRAPSMLKPEGALVLVAQCRLKLESTLGAHFQAVRMLAEDGGFRVWEGRGVIS